MIKDVDLKDFNLEEAMAELEKINRQLEEGQVSLQDSISLYKKGQEIATKCNAYLMNAEKEIQQISEDGKTKSVDTSGWDSYRGNNSEDNGFDDQDELPFK